MYNAVPWETAGGQGYRDKQTCHKEEKPSYLPGRPRNPGTESASETCGAGVRANMASMNTHANQANIQCFAGKLHFLPGSGASER